VRFLATDHDESRLHSLALSINPHHVFPQDNYQLIDIRDSKSVTTTFAAFAPTIVIHAAALKHLSVLEVQPREAMLTNVYGTSNVLNTCKDLGVDILVNISTDKAASPTSVLGRSKKLAEMIVAEANTNSDKLKFYSCRFGNVFASRGSVIETFESQINSGRSISLTDREVTRYFMSIPEAAFLSIKSILLDDADLFIFDMGEPIKILDLVKQMMLISGKEVSIDIVGLGNGEKLHEVLTSNNEVLKKTNHKDIKSAKLVDELKHYKNLFELVSERNDEKILEYLKKGLKDT
jgi:FlaA1/EpsC-like NDP-sugar epimerase